MSNAATGEGFIGYKWAEALSHRVHLTVAALQHPAHSPLGEQLPEAEVVTWPELKLFQDITPFRSMLKPEYPLFFRHIRRFLASEAKRFDLAHHFLPMAMRYVTPLRGQGIPYIMGPLGGGLETPPGLASEVKATSWFTRLRGLDKYRRRYDPWLRATYSDAAMVLGVAPYIRDNLGNIPIKRYENMLELGIDELAPVRPPRTHSGLRLLHVGRGVRTKGLRELVHALALLRDRPDITLTSAGGGEEIELCRQEAERLGVADRITFLGRIPRAQVEDLYAASDAFVFPSFREPTGGVFYEAMRWGLPIVAVRYGGPNWIVNDSCGILVDANSSQQMARDVADAILRLDDDGLRDRLGAGARTRVASELWPAKADRLVQLYHEVLGRDGATAARP